MAKERERVNPGPVMDQRTKGNDYEMENLRRNRVRPPTHPSGLGNGMQSTENNERNTSVYKNLVGKSESRGPASNGETEEQ